MFVLLLAVLSGGRVRGQVNIQFNIGTQPVWGPVGYDYVEYYYIPDIDAYYNVSSQEYVYYDNRSWVTMRTLPPQYRNFDLYRAHKVVINEPSPWTHHDRYRTQYVHYKGKHDQQAIRNARQQKYWENPGHPQHSKWQGRGQNNSQHGPDQHPGRGPGKDQRPGNDRGHERGGDRGEGNRGHGNGHNKGGGNGHGNGHGKKD